MSKMTRQLQLYDRLCCVPAKEQIATGVVIGPEEIMEEFGISRRMLQRDLKDFRDSGLINIKYFKPENMYILAEKSVCPKDSGERHKQHLQRLFRLGTLLTKLTRTYKSEIENHETLVREWEEDVEYAKEDPETFSPDLIDAAYEEMLAAYPDLPDLKAEYHALFPDCSERTRQRDFKEIARAGFDLYYSRDYKTYIFEYDDTSY